MSRFAYYVVWVGKEPGIYTTWGECKAQTNGVSGSCFKKYDTFEAAWNEIRQSPAHAPGVIPPSFPFSVPTNADFKLEKVETSSSYNEGDGGHVKVTVEDKGKRVIVDGHVNEVCSTLHNLKL